MKLYASPFASSIAVRIALAEAGLAAETRWVDLASRRTDEGIDLAAVNPKGQVPVLALCNGSVLTEAAAILQYVGDRKPRLPLAPPPATFERYRLQEWLNFIATELHKTLDLLLILPPMLDATTVEATRRLARQLLPGRFATVAQALDTRSFLLGEYFTVADAYLYAMLIWARHVEIDLAPWPVLGRYFARLGNRPAIARVVEEERSVRRRMASAA
jgi:glutathione S-transferase